MDEPLPEPQKLVFGEAPWAAALTVLPERFEDEVDLVPETTVDRAAWVVDP
ncbi:hypothetical protein [Streptomyces rapamycinicus]|uniref:hypothetical protein n=1 Tax=Streptomyces rapamycinicus TaxID=1226757 RepID=UPI0004207723|nr:hypothetical protein [Streptomyces rapamycinicus]UTP34976.1 hypothetical protein LIV37_40180 [Streptomyces rapamycinicus NRRL 5491]